MALFIRKGRWNSWYIVATSPKLAINGHDNVIEQGGITSHVYTFKSEASMKTLAIAMQQGKTATNEAIREDEVFRDNYGQEPVYTNLFRQTTAMWFQGDLISEVDEESSLELIIREAGSRLQEAIDSFFDW